MPWLAAAGPLSYSPEEPPQHDYYFQYGWVLPQVCTPEVRRKRHLYFGAPIKDYAREIFEFWALARAKRVERVLYRQGGRTADGVDAPIAVYRHATRFRGDGYMLIQHGSYQALRVQDQPFLEQGLLLLHRGIGEAQVFDFPCAPTALRATRAEDAWRRYTELQLDVLSKSDVSFNSIHDRAKRSETSHIHDGTWMTDELAAERGLEIERDGDVRELWRAAHQSFALAEHVAERKFGPSRVICRTPIGNVRMTTFFAGEHEVRVIDPGRVDIVESIGCQVARRPLWSKGESA